MLAKVWAEAWRQGPFAGLLLSALLAGYYGVWVWGSTYRDAQAACVSQDAAKDAELARYKDLSFNAISTLVDRAQQSAKVNEAVTTPQSKKPVLATIKVPVTALTETEKKDIQKPKDAEPATLENKLKATQKVLAKTEINNAQTVAPKKP